MASSKKREKTIKKNKSEKFGVGILILIISIAAIYLIFTSVLIGSRTSLEVGEIADETIKAPRDIEDTYSTELAKQEARKQAGLRYKKDEDLSEQVMTGLANAIAAIDTVRALGVEEYNRMRNEGAEIKYTTEFYEQCLTELPEGFITGDVANILRIDDDEEIIRLGEEITTLIQEEIDAGVVENSLESRKTDLQNQLVLSGFNSEARKLGTTLIDLYLRANMIFDAEATEKSKKEAEALVQPIVYSEGDEIVQEGSEITQAQLQMLVTLGLVEDKKDGWIEYLAIGLVVFVLCVLIIIYLTTFNKEIAFTNKLLSLTMVIIVTALLIIWFFIQFQDIGVYFIPTAYVPLMLYLLLGDRRAAIYINSILSLMLGYLYVRTGEGILLPIVLASLVSGTVAVFASKNASQRSSIFYAGLVSGAVMGIIYASFDLLNRLDYKIIGASLGWGILSGLFVAVLTVGTLPVFEATYKIVTPMKLMELTNPNQPLLKKLLLEAPGTYHHSIMVGNMAERAADAVGANALLVRTAAYYHDVGKSKRPHFFVENHADNRNPHDNINSKSSVDVITSHLDDGIDMLRRANIPPIVQEIVSQHHGDTAVMYFYLKDKEESNYPENIKIDNYRYKGERPKTKEAGILMLADSCEAAVKSLENATREMVKERIDSVVKGKLDDGQLDYCSLTLKEISDIKAAFLVALTGLFHERIEYPDAGEEE